MRSYVHLLPLVLAVGCGSVSSVQPDAGDDDVPDASTTVTLTITTSGDGEGTVTSSPAGIDCGATCTLTVDSGTSVTLTAGATTGSTFGGWTGGGCAGTGSCAVTLTANVTIDAAFDAERFTLTAAKTGNGTGTVASAPAGISCGSDCDETFAFGTSVTLTATADSGSTFLGWSGGGCTGTGTCVVDVTADTTVTAAFGMNNALVVVLAGNGTGVVTSNPAGINCGTDCSEVYPPSTSVTLSATPLGDSTFTGWSGACTGTGTCVVTVDAAVSVTATFTLNQHTLTVTRNGSGTGTVTSSPSGINCGADCTETYNSGTSVVLTATPTSSSVFSGWSGGGCSGTGACTVSMTAATTVTATFTARWTLTVTKTGTGTGTVISSPTGINCGSDCTELYTHNTTVTLTATPTTGFFQGWSGGGCSGNGTCVVTMTAATTVTATFSTQLRVAIEAPAGSCARGTGDALETLVTRLTNRGHMATLVVATDIDTLAELNQYDVLVIAPMGSACTGNEMNLYDANITEFLMAGNGLVSTGWFMYGSYLDVAPEITAAMPTNRGSQYNGSVTITPQGTHPISNGLGTFTTEFNNYGGNTKTGATNLGTDGTQNAGAAWSVSGGRAVYLAPIYLEDYGVYNAEPLMDGTQPAALEWLMRGIEWAGFRL